MTAEGVEDGAQLNTLRSLGCDLGQGYYFAKAMPSSRFVAECLNHAFEAMPNANPEEEYAVRRRA